MSPISRVAAGAWPITPLGDVCQVVTGSTPPRGESRYFGGSVPWIKPEDLDTSLYVVGSKEYLTDDGARLARRVPKGSVLVSCIGKIGKVAIAGVDLAVNQQINCLVPGPRVVSEYLYYAMRFEQGNLQDQASNTIVPILNKSRFAAVGIPLPPLADQQRIVAKLDEQMAALDHAQAALDSQSLAVDLAKSGLLCSVLERAASHQTGTASLPSVCDIIMGQSPPGDTYNNLGQGMPFYQGRVDFGELSPATRVWCSTPQKVAEPGDVLLCVRAPVGPTNIASERCCVGRGLAALHCKPMLDPMFLLWTLRAREDKWSKLSAGSTFEAITRTQLDSFTLLVPGKEEQRTIARKMSEQWQLLLDTSNLIAVRSEQLTHLKAALLDAAFSGEI